MRKKLILLMLVLVGSGNAAWGQVAVGSLRVAGASTIQPLAQQLAEMSPSLSAVVSGGGSGAGVLQVVQGRAEIGMVSRSLTAAERSQLLFTTIARDALVFVVNASNPLHEIALATVRRIFDGSLTNWREINGVNQTIVAVNKEVGRATLELFEGYSGLLHPDRNQRGVAGTIAVHRQIGSNLEMATIVGGLRNAIGYLSLGAAEQLIEAGMPIRILTLDGRQANRSSVLDGSYGINRELNLVYRVATPAIQGFVDAFFEPLGIEIVQRNGFIPTRRTNATN